MLFAMHFIFKIVEAPVSMYKVLIEEIMYILYSALNKQTVGWPWLDVAVKLLFLKCLEAPASMSLVVWPLGKWKTPSINRLYSRHLSGHRMRIDKCTKYFF